jgi:hypothetical protein
MINMKNVLIFALGVAAGSLLTWKIVEEKYRQIANDEIESVREYYRNKNDEDLDNKAEFLGTEDSEEVYVTKSDVTELEKQLSDLGYSNEEVDDLINDPDVIIEPTDDGIEIWMEPSGDYIKPFVISPDEYGDDGYEMKSLTYYADFVLADNEDDEIISDPESIIGDGLKHFGEYESDAVHVRNKNNECDYEILKHEKTFSEIVGG